MCDATDQRLVRCLDHGEVSPDGLEHREVSGDGNCFWHSLALLLQGKWKNLKQTSLQDLSAAEAEALSVKFCMTPPRLRAQVSTLRAPGCCATTLAATSRLACRNALAGEHCSLERHRAELYVCT
eukprot:2818689-Amphidinium_carterae.2